MERVGTFDTLDSREKELFAKYYNFLSPITVTSVVKQEDLVFKASAKQIKASDLILSAGIAYSRSLANEFSTYVSLKKQSSGMSKLVLQLAKSTSAYDVTGRFKLLVSQQGLSSVDAPSLLCEVSTDKTNVQFGLCNNPFVLRLAALAKLKDFTLGADAQIGLNSDKHTKLEFAAGWMRKNARILVKHESKTLEIGEVELSYLLDLEKNLKIGAVVRTDWARKTTGVKFGGEYLCNDSLFKGMVTSNGKIGLALKKKLNENFEIVVSSEIDGREVTSTKVADYSFGLTVNFVY
jgi:hypothetical protein